MPRPPHLLIFNPDQWRGDVLGHLGNPAAHTPFIDRYVREEAVSFRHAFCQNPVCTPSRCSFMTGWYPHVRGHRTMHHMLQPDEPMLLRTLRAAGYHVWWGGKNDVVPRQRGFSDYCDVKFTPTDTLPDTHALRPPRGDSAGDTDHYSFYVGKLEKPAGADRYRDQDWALIEGAIAHIRNAPPDRPLCIYLPLTYPHPPYAVEDPYYSAIDPHALPPRIRAEPAEAGKPAILRGLRELQGLRGWSEARWSELRRTYYGMCARVDDQFRLVIEALKQSGRHDDTAVFLFSDHGDYTGDYGLVEKTQNTFEDCLTRVPFIIKPPRGHRVRPGIRDALVELIDFPATVEALCGITPAHTHFGRSLLPLVAGDTDTHRDAVFCEGGRLPTERHTREAESLQNSGKTSRYWPRLHLQTGDGPEHGKAAMCRTDRYKYIMRLLEPDEFYDLRTDPGETRNEIDNPAYAAPIEALRRRLLRWYMETADVVPHTPDCR